jgi:hypothetical protein
MKYYFECPACRNDEEFSLPREDSAGLTYMLWVWCGFIPALLFADATRHRVQCARCGYIFRQPCLPRTSLSIMAAWVIGIVLLFGTLTILMIGFPEVTDLLPQSLTLQEIELLISDHPRAILFGLFPMIAALLLLSVCVSWASNHRARAELRKRFITKPKPWAEARPVAPTSG